MGIRDWDIVTSYVDSVTTTLKTVTFPKVQEQVKVKNQGNANLTYTIGSQSGTLTPGQSVTVNEDISSFTIQAASGTQAFELRAKEKGTEKTEDTSSDVVSLLSDILNVKTPTLFGWQDHPLKGKIYKNETGYHTYYDVGVNEIKGKTYYVDSISGNNNNDGLTPSTALNTILAAYNKTDVKVIVLCNIRGFYTSGLQATVINKSITIKTLYNTRATITNYTWSAWSKTAATTNVYQSAVANASAVVDLQRKDANGYYLALTQVSDLATCDTTNDSYFISGSTVYVHYNGGGTPSAYTFVICNDRNALYCNFTQNGSLYLENIDVLGGFSTSGVGNVYAKNCNFLYGKFDDGFKTDFTNAILQNCNAAYSSNDGFGYSHGTAVEINCKGHDNGLSADSNDNGSTGHVGAKIIRINGSYYNNYGPNIGDVQQDTESWNMGCNAYNSKVVNTSSFQHSDFQTNNDGVPGNTKMFLEGCTSYGSSYGVQAQAGTIYIKHNQFTTYRVDATQGGQILDY